MLEVIRFLYKIDKKNLYFNGVKALSHYNSLFIVEDLQGDIFIYLIICGYRFTFGYYPTAQELAELNKKYGNTYFFYYKLFNRSKHG